MRYAVQFGWYIERNNAEEVFKDFKYKHRYNIVNEEIGLPHYTIRSALTFDSLQEASTELIRITNDMDITYAMRAKIIKVDSDCDDKDMSDGVKKGKAEAQEVYRRLSSYHKSEYDYIFGRDYIDAIINDFTVDEIEQKFNDYENRIKVGDELSYYTQDAYIAVATHVSSDGKNISVMFYDGSTSDKKEADKWHKTGRHFDEIEILLNKMRDNT